MKIREIKRKLREEQYDIPDVLAKIKANLPEVKPKYTYQPRKQTPVLRRAIGFASLIFIFLIVFTSLTSPITQANQEGPVNLNYFSSENDITKLIKKNNQKKDNYLSSQQNLIDGYHLDEINVNKVYDFDNNTAITYKNRIYYLNDEGLVIYNAANDDLVAAYTDALDFDIKTNVKTMYLVNKNLIVIYNNKNYINVVKYNVDTLHKLYTYSIASTFISSHIHENKLYLVSILNNPIFPFIKEYNYKKIISPNDIGYLDNIMGDSYTILTTIDLVSNDSHEKIFLSFDKWDFVYFKQDHLYLVNNHMNFKKNLEYGEYTTVVKFQDSENLGMNYRGSYTLKGSVRDKTHIYEHNGNLRMVLEVSNYQVNRSFIFFKKVKTVNYYINVVNLNTIKTNDNYNLNLSSNYIIQEDNDFDSAITILATKFINDFVVIETIGLEHNSTILDFTDPNKIVTESSQRQKPYYSNIIALNKSYGFNIKAIKPATGEFEIKFYNLNPNVPKEIVEHQLNLDYSDLVTDSSYVIIEAIKYSSSLYLNESDNYYYIGFAARNNENTNGLYTIVRIDKETKESTVNYLDLENIIINKVVSYSSNEFYALANKHVIKFSLEDDNFLEQLKILGIE